MQRLVPSRTRLAALAATMLVGTLGIGATPAGVARANTIEPTPVSVQMGVQTGPSDDPFTVGWSLSLDGNQIASDEYTGVGAFPVGSPETSSDAGSLEPGAYLLEFSYPSGWISEQAPTCHVDGEMSIGSSVEFTLNGDPTPVTCEINVASQMGTIKVTKYIDDPDDGGEFLILATANNEANSDSGWVYAETNSPDWVELEAFPGSPYTIEEDLDYNWDSWIPSSSCLGDVAPEAVTAVAGETTECSIVNTRGVHVQINKEFNGAYFDMGYDATFVINDTTMLTVPDQGNQQTVVAAGDITIDETALNIDGQDLIGWGYCSIGGMSSAEYDFVDGHVTIPDAAPGDWISCYVDNDAPATIVITNHTDPATDTTFGVTRVQTGESQSIGDGESATFITAPNSADFLLEDVAGWRLDSFICSTGGDWVEGDWMDGDTLRLSSLEPGMTVECDIYQVQSLTVQKTSSALTPLDEPGRYAADYTLTVTNPFDAPASLELDDALQTDRIRDIVATATVLDGDAIAVELDDTFDADVQQHLAHVEFDGAGQQQIMVHVELTIEPNLGGYERLCTSPESALHNLATLFDTEFTQLDDDSVCTDIPDADITVDKQVVGDLIRDENGVYTVTYSVDVANVGDGFAMVDLRDNPMFAYGYLIDQVFVQAEGDTEPTEVFGDGDYLIAEGVALGAGDSASYTVTITFIVDNLPYSPVCDGWYGGLHNEVTVDQGGFGEPFLFRIGPSREGSTADACIDGPDPRVTFDKSITDYRYLGDNTVAVDYVIDIANTHIDALDTSFNFRDEVDLGAPGVTVDGYEVTGAFGSDGTTPLDVESYGQFEDPALFGAYGGIAAGESAHWHVTVEYSIDTQNFNGTCSDVGPMTKEGPGGFVPGGLSNLLIGYQGEGMSTVSTACLDISLVGFDKTVVNDDGGELASDAFEMNVIDTESGEIERTLTDGDLMVVASGDYTLEESAVAGYTPGEITCVPSPTWDGEAGPVVMRLTAAPVGSFAASTAYACSVSNDDQPVALSLTKAASSASAVAGVSTSPVTFTITASNAGRPADAGDDATVVDTLPAGWVWVAGSVTGCKTSSIAGQVLTCTIAADRLETSESATVTAQAYPAGTATIGTYVNVATIGNADQPAPATATCPAAGAQPGATACVSVDVTKSASMRATLTASSTTPVKPGDQVELTATMFNDGPSPLLPGTTLSLTLPAQLELVSASGASWTCTGTVTVSCSFADAVPAGSSSAVVITAKVAAGAEGSVTITADFLGYLELALDVPTGFTEAITVGATASTSASATFEIVAAAVVVPDTTAPTTPVTTVPAAELPRTGSNTTQSMVMIATIITLLGAAMATTRRRSKAATTA